MAKQAGKIVAGICAMMCCVSLWAQQKGATKAVTKNTATPVKDTTKAKRKFVKPVVYLGHSTFAGGEITAAEFGKLLKQGITSKDEAGRDLKVIGFNFNYAERRLFENEEGDMSMQIDYASEYCPGDTISTNISSSIYDRVKGGDTVYIGQVLLERKIGNDIDTISGKEMKCVIKKAPTPKY